MIKELEEDREESQDPEVEFSIAGAVRECGGLEIILGIIQHSQDKLKSNQEQLAAVLNLLMLCCKIRENRRALLRLGALNVLLDTAQHAFSVDAMEPAYFDCGEPEATSSCCCQILEIISSCCLVLLSYSSEECFLVLFLHFLEELGGLLLCSDFEIAGD
ncbi:auxin transport protein BIG-like isoform X2 [Rhododendron vialii]|nr:auxin transport protein BIG-like isoform X2 [Rhododendron vialii]